MIDAHMHAVSADTKDYGDFQELTGFASCTAQADEWDAQAAIDDDRIVRFYGVHPWYAEQWTLENKKRLYDILQNDPKAQVGEIGLDSKRGQILGQTMIMIQQLDLAEYFQRVVTIHDVGCEKMVLDSLKGRKLKAILHSYGSDSYIKPYSEMECYFSISPRILSRSEIRVRRLLDAIPEDRLLLESDYPSSGKGYTGMRDFAASLGTVIGKDADSLLMISEDNFRRLFP